MIGLYIYEENDTYNLYGITSSADSYSRSFLGGAFCWNDGVFPTMFKPLYYKEDKILINDILWPVTYDFKFGRDNRMDVRHNVNLIFCNNYVVNRGKIIKYDSQSCLDLSGKTYPYFIYLYYNENDISKVSSITIEPSNPKDIKTISK